MRQSQTMDDTTRAEQLAPAQTQFDLAIKRAEQRGCDRIDPEAPVGAFGSAF